MSLDDVYGKIISETIADGKDAKGFLATDVAKKFFQNKAKEYMGEFLAAETNLPQLHQAALKMRMLLDLHDYLEDAIDRAETNMGSSILVNMKR